MAKGINKVILVGHLGQDPEVRYTQSGSAIANVSIATTESWTDKQSGQKQERTEWHRVVFFNRLGEIVGEYLRKGSQVYVEGALRTRKWQDKDGQDRYTTEIVASEMQMLGGRGESAGAPMGGYNNQPTAQPNYGGMPQNAAPQGNFQQPAAAQPAYGAGRHAPQHSSPQGSPSQGSQQSRPAPEAPSMDSFDDDIPF